MSSFYQMQLNPKLIFSIFVSLLMAAGLLTDADICAQEEPPPPGDMEESEYGGIMKNLEKGIWIPYTNLHFYGKEGFRIDSPNKNFTIKINEERRPILPQV